MYSSYKLINRNSTLQCLFNVPGFASYFVGDKYKAKLSATHNDVAEQFALLLRKVRSHLGAPSPYSDVSTYGLKRAIQRVCPTFSGYDQQDAQELLKALLEGTNEDCNCVTKKPAYKELKIHKSKTVQQNVICITEKCS